MYVFLILKKFTDWPILINLSPKLNLRMLQESHNTAMAHLLDKRISKQTLHYFIFINVTLLSVI